MVAIILSWMIYGFYQPQILQSLGFVELANWLGIIQGLIGAVIEPLVGWLSDLIMRRVGSRLPAIAAGVTLAGLIFVIVSWLVGVNLPTSLRWLVPVLMTVWVTAMIIFRGPAIALLRLFAPVEKLPQANAILTFVFALVTAFGPLINIFLKDVGASAAFILGAIALLLGSMLMLLTAPRQRIVLPENMTEMQPSVFLLASIFAVGIGAGVEINILLSVFPSVLQSQLSDLSFLSSPNLGRDLITSGILLFAAFAAIPLGYLVIRLTANGAMLIGLGAIVALMGIALVNQSSFFALVLIVLFGLGFGLVFTSMIPFALETVPPSQAGFGTGLYFGGGGAAGALVALLSQSGMSSQQGFLWSAIAFVSTSLCILFSSKLMVPKSSGAGDTESRD